MFAANGTRLGFIQSDELRTPVSWSEIPRNLSNATIAIEGQRFYQNDGVDLTGIFRAAVKDLNDRRCAAGRLDDHDAADAQPVPRRRRAHAAPRRSSRRSSAIDYNKHHSKRSILDELSQQRPLRHARRADRGRGAGSSAPVLRQAGLAAGTSSSQRCSGPAAGAFAVQPAAVPAGSARAAQRGAREDGRSWHYISYRAARAAGGRRACSPPRLLHGGTQRELLLRIRPPAARGTLRREHRRCRAA